MASRSAFVDALLASPITAAARRRGRQDSNNTDDTDAVGGNGNNDTNDGLPPVTTIDFSDVPERTWLKMMDRLEPGGLLDDQGCSCRNLRDIVEVLPFYEQYQFMDGIHLCDFLLQTEYRNALHLNDASYYTSHADLNVTLGKALCKSIELNLPLSTPLAVKLAGQLLMALAFSDREQVEYLLSAIVEEGDDDSVMGPLLQAVYGKIKPAWCLHQGQEQPSNQSPVEKFTGKRKRTPDASIDFDEFWQRYEAQSKIVEHMDSKRTMQCPTSRSNVRIVCQQQQQQQQQGTDPTTSTTTQVAAVANTHVETTALLGSGLYQAGKTEGGIPMKNPKMQRRGAMRNVWVLATTSDTFVVGKAHKSSLLNQAATLGGGVGRSNSTDNRGDNRMTKVLLRATDPVGSKWEIARYTFPEMNPYQFESLVPDGKEEAKTVLYRWSGISSELPPTTGWEAVEDSKARVVSVEQIGAGSCCVEP